MGNAGPSEADTALGHMAADPIFVDTRHIFGDSHLYSRGVSDRNGLSDPVDLQSLRPLHRRKTERGPGFDRRWKAL